MKLTWFGGTTLRVYVGGEIVVVDPDTAPAGVSQQELRSGADRVVSLRDPNPRIDPERWTVPRPSRPMDNPRPLEVMSIGLDTCLISGESDPPLLILNVTDLPRFGHWVDGAVIVLFGEKGAALVADIVVLDLAKPKHLVLAAENETIERLFDRVDATDLDDSFWRDHSFSSLEPGLAVEV
jgi:hypothetical protein